MASASRAADEPAIDAARARFALIYLNDEALAGSFAELLKANGHAVDLVKLDDAATADFAPYGAVIVSPDIQRAWSSSTAKKIADTKKPVMGVGEGGAMFFEKIGLHIGWMKCWMGGDVGLRAVGDKDLDFWSTAPFKIPEDGELALYSESPHMGCFAPEPQAGVVPLGQELKNTSHYPLIEQNRRYVLWGFGGSPQKMTTEGKQLFVHTARYVASAGDGPASTSPEATTAAKQESAGPPAAIVGTASLQPSQTVHVQTQGGTFEITTTDPAIETAITEKGLRVNDRQSNRHYDLRAAEGEAPAANLIAVAEQPTGLKFKTDRFEIARRAKTAVQVAYISAADAKPQKASADEMCVFLGCGTTGAPGTIEQVSAPGKVLGSIGTNDPANGLVRSGETLVVANATPMVNGGQTLIVRADGKLEDYPLKEDFPAPLAISIEPKTRDLVIADNEWNTVSRLRASKPEEAELLFRAPLTAEHKHYPSMSVAVVGDSHVAFSASDPKGVFLVPMEAGATLPKPLLPGYGTVAAQVGSETWIATQRSKLMVFEGSEEVRSIACPAGSQFGQYHVAAFAPSGELWVVLSTGKGTEIESLDLTSGEFTSRFVWTGGNIQAMAVGPRMAWQK